MEKPTATPIRRKVVAGTAAAQKPPAASPAAAPATTVPRRTTVIPTAQDALTPPPEREGAAQAPPKERQAFPWENRGAWGVVVEDLNKIDVEATYRRLVDSLALGVNHTDRGIVLNALNNAEKNAFNAGQLARLAKLEQELVEQKCDRELEVLRTDARKELDQEKKDGTRTKAPTIQDVDDRIMAKWPDRVSSLRTRKEEAHGVRGTMDNLLESWRSRCFSLRTLADKLA